MTNLPDQHSARERELQILIVVLQEELAKIRDEKYRIRLIGGGRRLRAELMAEARKRLDDVRLAISDAVFELHDIAQDRRPWYSIGRFRWRLKHKKRRHALQQKKLSAS